MTYFTRFARETTKEYNFIAVACNTNSTTAGERKDLIHLITSNGWREDGSIWHATSQCASSVYEATNHIWKNTTGGKAFTSFIWKVYVLAGKCSVGFIYTLLECFLHN